MITYFKVCTDLACQQRHRLLNISITPSQKKKKENLRLKNLQSSLLLAIGSSVMRRNKDDYFSGVCQ